MIGEIPKEIDMEFGGRKWRLEISNVREMNEYFGKFNEKINSKKTNVNIDELILNNN